MIGNKIVLHFVNHCLNFLKRLLCIVYKILKRLHNIECIRYEILRRKNCLFLIARPILIFPPTLDFLLGPRNRTFTVSLFYLSVRVISLARLSRIVKKSPPKKNYLTTSLVFTDHVTRNKLSHVTCSAVQLIYSNNFHSTEWIIMNKVLSNLSLN